MYLRTITLFKLLYFSITSTVNIQHYIHFRCRTVTLNVYFKSLMLPF